MSAFMCGDEVFAEVARFFRDVRPDLLGQKYAHLGLTPVSFAECLRVMNRHSILARYPSEATEPFGLEGQLPFQPLDIESATVMTPIQARKQLECILYQSCETDRWNALGDWFQTLIDDVCVVIIDRDGRVLSPGYMEAAWGDVNEPTPAPVRLVRR